MLLYPEGTCVVGLLLLQRHVVTVIVFLPTLMAFVGIVYYFKLFYGVIGFYMFWGSWGELSLMVPGEPPAYKRTQGNVQV